MKLKSIAGEIASLKERNKKVEADKAWETSKARRAIIALATYLLIAIILVIIGAPNPWVTALIPAVGYVVSTLTMPIFKDIWTKLFYKR